MAAPNWTLTQILNQLNTGNLWVGTEITYSFPTSSGFMHTGGGEGGGFQGLTGNQAALATYALTGWDDLITLDFVLGAGSTGIEFGYTTSGIDFAHAYYPGNGSVWFNAGENILFNPTIGKYGFAIMTVMRTAGVLTVVSMATAIFVMIRRDRRRNVGQAFQPDGEIGSGVNSV